MSKRSSSTTSTKTINPSGFSFTIKHKAPSFGNSMSMPNIDLSKPIIKFKANSAVSSKNSSSKKGGRKTRKRTMRKKTHRKTHVRKTHHKKRSSKTHRKK